MNVFIPSARLIRRVILLFQGGFVGFIFNLAKLELNDISILSGWMLVSKKCDKMVSKLDVVVDR